MHFKTSLPLKWKDSRLQVPDVSGKNRKANGQFKPGVSGNPKGRPPADLSKKVDRIRYKIIHLNDLANDDNQFRENIMAMVKDDRCWNPRLKPKKKLPSCNIKLIQDG